MKGDKEKEMKQRRDRGVVKGGRKGKNQGRRKGRAGRGGKKGLSITVVT